MKSIRIVENRNCHTTTYLFSEFIETRVVYEILPLTTIEDDLELLHANFHLVNVILQFVGVNRVF